MSRRSRVLPVGGIEQALDVAEGHLHVLRQVDGAGMCLVAVALVRAVLALKERLAVVVGVRDTAENERLTSDC